MEAGDSLMGMPLGHKAGHLESRTRVRYLLDSNSTTGTYLLFFLFSYINQCYLGLMFFGF